MKFIRKVCAFIGAAYLVLTALAMLNVIDMHTCIAAAGKCHVSVEREGE